MPVRPDNPGSPSDRPTRVAAGSEESTSSDESTVSTERRIAELSASELVLIYDDESRYADPELCAMHLESAACGDFDGRPVFVYPDECGVVTHDAADSGGL
jgi:hypothetical protein